jgi:murein DD-endopeptidase MepM/ murein hydrolase activator NlpD
LLRSSSVGLRRPTAPSTRQCAGPYPEQSTSPYILPWRVGETYRVGQGNCGSGSHAAGTIVQCAYDVLMPVGTAIVAARSGAVLLVEERFVDGTRIPGQENYINVIHADGTIAGYVHLTRAGALVDVGDEVTQGQVIGLSGDSGSGTAASGLERHEHHRCRAAGAARPARAADSLAGVDARDG